MGGTGGDDQPIMAHKRESHQPSLFDEETPRVALCRLRGGARCRASMSKITAKHPQRSA
jgi:hypothetical protein